MSRFAVDLPKKTTTPQKRKPPFIHTFSPLGSAGKMKRDALGFLLAAHQYGDVVGMRFLLWPTYLIFHPDDIKYILQENNRNYSKDFYTYRILRHFFGMGLLTNDGHSWLQQRRLIQPAFHRKRLATYGTVMAQAATDMVERWQATIAPDQQVNIAAEMMRVTQRIVGQVLFGIDLSDDADEVGKAVSVLNGLVSDYFYNPLPPLSVPTARNRRIHATQNTLDTVVRDIISERRQHNTDSSDLLSMLLAARDEETGEGMSDTQVRDEVMTLLLAGHETTATALSWTWYLLARHPEAERRVHDEVDTVLNGHAPTVEALSALPYTRMVIDEALRLYPTVWSFSRKVIADDEVGGYHIPANSLVELNPYATHRHPAFWEDPERFDPERFTPERSANRPPYAYFPFAGGPRLCIGNNFALMETHLILATVAQHFQLHLSPGVTVQPQPMVTLRPRNGMPMTLVRRQ